MGADDRVHLACGMRRPVRHAHVGHERALRHAILVVIVFIVQEGALVCLLRTLRLEKSSQLDSRARGRKPAIIRELVAKLLGLALLALIALDSLRQLGIVALEFFILHGQVAPLEAKGRHFEVAFRSWAGALRQRLARLSRGLTHLLLEVQLGLVDD